MIEKTTKRPVGDKEVITVLKCECGNCNQCLNAEIIELKTKLQEKTEEKPMMTDDEIWETRHNIGKHSIIKKCQCERLKEIVKEYANHKPDCGFSLYTHGCICTCGLIDALKEVVEDKEEPKEDPNVPNLRKPHGFMESRVAFGSDEE